MKVLVTGALGFIGSNLTERLIADGNEVSALDNLHTGSEENVEKIKDKVKIFNMGAGDIGKTGEKYDAIFHNGIYSSSPMYKKNPHLTAKALDDFIAVLEFGGALPWEPDSTKAVVACPDPHNVVVFELERLEEVTS